MVGKLRRKFGVRIVLIALMAVVALAVWKGLTRPPDPYTITIGTATPGGTYELLGKEFARILKDLPGGQIQEAKAINTAGSVDNIQKLQLGDVNVALVSRHALENEAVKPEHVRVLARLYQDVVQLVVREGKEIRKLIGLRKKTIYIGREKSGTRVLVKELLDAAGLVTIDASATDEERKKNKDACIVLDDDDSVKSFKQAADALLDGRLAAAFFVSGAPTEAVRKVLKNSKFRLLSLDDNVIEKMKNEYPAAQIPAHTYDNQDYDVSTLGTDAFLVCREDLPEEVAKLLLKAFFDHMDALLLAHARAEEIRLVSVSGAEETDDAKEAGTPGIVTPFDGYEIPGGLTLHPGAVDFEDTEKKTLYLATGALNGRYHGMGQIIQGLLEPYGWPVRAVHTDGSVENARLLNRREHSIAMMQYDVVLVCLGIPLEKVYRTAFNPGLKIPRVAGIRRIAVLHDELLHVVVRRKSLEGVPEANRKTTIGALRYLKPGGMKLQVCLGPELSGTRLVAQAVLKHHRIKLEGKKATIDDRPLPVVKMVKMLHSEQLDAGFFVGGVPSEALKTVLNDPEMRLLSLEPDARAKMIASPAFKTVEIKAETYACQKKEEKLAIQTIATRAVLVTTLDSKDIDVHQITKAIFERAEDLEVPGGAKAMAKKLPFLRLHPDTREYYLEAGYLPSKPPFTLLDFFNHAWKILAVFVILAGAWKGTLALRRLSTANEVGRRVLAVPLAATERIPVGKLRQLRVEVQDRVQRRWWKWGEIDKPRWRYLDDLIEDRISVAKDTLTRAVLATIRREATASRPGDSPQREQYVALKARIWRCLEIGELDAGQHDLLLKILDETSQTSSEKETG